VIPEVGGGAGDWPGVLPPGVTLEEGRRMAALLLEAVDTGEPTPELVAFYVRVLGQDRALAEALLRALLVGMRRAGRATESEPPPS
jgi:recombinational DNA repair protein (RecF pathway)